MSDDEIEIQDADSCSPGELSSFFQYPLELRYEHTIPEENYILSMDFSPNFDRGVVQTSKGSAQVFDLKTNRILNVRTLNKSDNGICGVKFAKHSPHIVFAASSDGGIFQHDLREGSSESFSLSDSKSRTFTCFDVNSDDTTVCVGSEQHNSESLLLFFDVRKKSTSLTFCDSHKDDITDIKFHPTKSNVVASGSTDGLINVFDTLQTDEDDALEYCLNTESSVQTLNWHQLTANKDAISCITHLNDLIVYDVEESEEIASFKRKKITKNLRRISPNDCYLVNTHSLNDGTVMLLAGSNFNNGECLRTLQLKGKKLVARNCLSRNQQIVRCSAYDTKNDILITAGEGSIISVWTPPTDTQEAVDPDSSHVKSSKKRKFKPY